jgi:ABC-type transporter MlaC component
MNMKLVSAMAILTAFASMPVVAQQQPNVPKASKAEVQKVLDGIKADKAKLAAYCASAKLDEQMGAIAAKDQKDPKLQSLGAQLEELNKKVGPDFEKIMNSELDEASGALLEDLTKSCK